MASRRVKVYRVDVLEYPPGSDQPGWRPTASYQSKTDENGDPVYNYFTWPRRRHYFTRESAHQRAHLLEQFGAKTQVVQSKWVEFEDDDLHVVWQDKREDVVRQKIELTAKDLQSIMKDTE